MVIESETGSDSDSIGKLVKMMYDKSPSRMQTSPSFHVDPPSENVCMEGNEEIKLSVELNAPFKGRNQSRTEEMVGLDKLAIAAAEMTSTSQAEIRMNLPIPSSFLWLELLFQMHQSIQEEWENWRRQKEKLHNEINRKDIKILKLKTSIGEVMELVPQIVQCRPLP